MASIPTLTPLTLPLSQLAALSPYVPPAGNGTTSTQTCSLTLTYAQSLDGQIALARNTQTILSGAETKAMTHFLRSRHDAILVGVGTAEADDPGLNCRFAEADDEGEVVGEPRVVGLSRQPRPVILDPSGRWSCRAKCKVLRLARERRGKGPLWVVSAENLSNVDAARVKTLREAGGELLCKDEFWEDGGVQWGVVLRRLWIKGIASVMVEGGGKVIEDLLKSENHELVDRVIITIAPVWLGRGGVMAAPRRERNGEVGRLEHVKWLQMGDDVVLVGNVKLVASETDMFL